MKNFPYQLITISILFFSILNTFSYSSKSIYTRAEAISLIESGNISCLPKEISNKVKKRVKVFLQNYQNYKINHSLLTKVDSFVEKNLNYNFNFKLSNKSIERILLEGNGSSNSFRLNVTYRLYNPNRGTFIYEMGTPWKTFGAQVIQNIPNGVLVQMILPYMSGIGPSNSFTIITNKEFIDYTTIKEQMFLTYKGPYNYISVLGSRKTILGFEEINSSIRDKKNKTINRLLKQLETEYKDVAKFSDLPSILKSDMPYNLAYALCFIAKYKENIIKYRIELIKCLKMHKFTDIEEQKQKLTIKNIYAKLANNVPKLLNKSETLINGINELYNLKIKDTPENEKLKPKNYLKLKVIKTKSNAGDSYYEAILGGVYRRGEYGQKINFSKAHEWINKSVSKKNPLGYYELGCLYYYGFGIEQDRNKAQSLYQKAIPGLIELADEGKVEAQSRLGACYSNGFGVKKNPNKAIEYFRKSANKGSALGQVNLASNYSLGFGLLKDPQTAFKWLTKSAEQGLSSAQYNLGLCYYKGEGVEKDTKQAVKWFARSAEQGYLPAQLVLGFSYYSGKGVLKNPLKAFKWFSEAAEKGDATAQLVVGEMYFNGIGVARDTSKSKEWIRKSYENGSTDAKLFWEKHKLWKY